VCALLAAGVSALLLMQHHGETSAVQAVNEVCGDGKTSGCEQVARSSWSSVSGVPLAAIGLAFSLVLAAGCAVALVSPPEVGKSLGGLALILLGAALGVDVALGFIQAFALKAFCGLCVATYVLNAVAFAALWPARATLGGALGRFSPESRPALVGLGIALLGLASGVWAFQQALSARAALRSATVLGGPIGDTPVPTATVAPTPEPGHEGHDHARPAPAPVAAAAASGPRNWQAEAQRLQAILDNPQQLQQYFTDKAAREYAAAKVEKIDLVGMPAKGPAEAPVKVVEYSDFLCPFCRDLAGGLSGFLPQAGGRVQIIYKHYPLDQTCNPNLQRSAHEGACLLAQGGVCAHEQGKFWAYHDKVFARPMERASREDVTRLAGESGLDPAAFGACIDAPRTKERLAAQIAEAKSIGVQSTPTVLINGKKLPRINDFLQVVDAEAQSKGFPKLQQGAPANH
jgi:protein-disulfide isomerase/uncharacterized membrane protein